MAKKVSCPSWLTKEAKKEFKRVAKLLEKENKDFTEKDIKALECYAACYAKWKMCEQILLEKGFSMTVNEEGYEQQRPEVSISNKAQQDMRAWAKELGLTPAARARMTKNIAESGGTKTKEEEEMEELIS